MWSQDNPATRRLLEELQLSAYEKLGIRREQVETLLASNISFIDYCKSRYSRLSRLRAIEEPSEAAVYAECTRLQAEIPSRYEDPGVI